MHARGIVTPLARWLRGVRERWLGTWDEGPEPPARLREMAVDFANRHPRATRAEWVELAAGLAGEAYRSGWVRAFEREERGHGYRPEVPPEVIADWMDPEWRWQRGIVLEDPMRGVPAEDEPEADVLRRHVDEVAVSTARRR